MYSFVLETDKSECLRRVAARGNMPPKYAEAAWNRYAPGGVCSTAEFKTIIDTQVVDQGAVVDQIIQTVGRSSDVA